MKTDKAPRRLSGTKEWAQQNINIQTGCEHGCRYCYARYDSVKRFKRCSDQAWAEPVIDVKKVDCDYRKYPGVVMFPSSHDITPKNLTECLIVIRKLIEAGNRLLIVSKPHDLCIRLICENFKDFREKVTFRFTIGSVKDEILKFWEPKAPGFAERLGCLKYAFDTGYNTSVSCEPFLDIWPHYVYDATADYITDSFWLGLLRMFEQRVDLTGVSEYGIEKYVTPLKKAQTRECITVYYRMLKDSPFVRFKDSIRDQLNLPDSND